MSRLNQSVVIMGAIEKSTKNAPERKLELIAREKRKLDAANRSVQAYITSGAYARLPDRAESHVKGTSDPQEWQICRDVSAEELQQAPEDMADSMSGHFKGEVLEKLHYRRQEETCEQELAPERQRQKNSVRQTGVRWSRRV